MKRKTDNFNKFFNRKRNSAVKEEIRQEKKLVKKERREAVEKHFEEKRKLKTAGSGVARPATGAAFSKPTKGSDIPRPMTGAAFSKQASDARSPKPANGTASQKSVGRVEKRSATPDNQEANDKSPVNFKGPVIRDKRPDHDKGALNGKVSAKQNKQPAHANQPIPDKGPAGSSETLPLNKYIAHAGVSSRRASALLVKEGRVTVNGIAVTDPGTKVLYTDTVKVNGKKVTVSSHFVYILLNKPKDFLTTTTDPQGRKTVQQLIAKATEERVYPIGRLDRNTSGVLLFTNDGDLAQKLSHPKNEMKKIYHAGLDKPLTKQHFEKIMGGIELEDGIARVDEMAYADPKDKSQIGLEIHSGKNRIVRRIFESLGYEVKTLDRVMYAGLTKKNVQRGNWRFLTEKEIRALKYLKA